MELTPKKAWIRLDNVHRNRESWGFDLGSEGEIETEYVCLNFLKKNWTSKRNG
jgi:hypothetical protein